LSSRAGKNPFDDSNLMELAAIATLEEVETFVCLVTDEAAEAFRQRRPNSELC